MKETNHLRKWHNENRHYSFFATVRQTCPLGRHIFVDGVCACGHKRAVEKKGGHMKKKEGI